MGSFVFGDPARVSPQIGTQIPVWRAATFCSGVRGGAYLQDFDFWPARPNITVTLISGALPAGLSLSQVSGTVWRLSGTPAAAGSYTFTLRAANSYGSADNSFTMSIGPGSSGGSYAFIGG